MSLKNRYVLVGTSHISSQSIEEIKNNFLEHKPDAICVELDAQRLYTLLHPQQKNNPWALLRQLGLRGFIFTLITRYAQQKLGKIVGDGLEGARSTVFFGLKLAVITYFLAIAAHYEYKKFRNKN